VSLAERVAEVSTTAKILTLDIETQRGVWESFQPKTEFLPAARCLVPPRILCAAGKWVGEDKTHFVHAWRDDDAEAMTKMLTTIHKWMNDADVIITYNGDRFDLTWCEQACSTVGLARIRPYKSIDLIKLARRKFGQGLTYKSLDWSARMYLRESKLAHGGRDLWHDIRHGTKTQQKDAQRTMREYNIRDVELTERLWLEVYLPYSPVNLGLFQAHADDDELLVCTTCGTTGKLVRDGITYTGVAGYQLYRCASCGGVSRGKRAKITTELRSVR
jgi:DNA polymerase elongation subunit (family B)